MTMECRLISVYLHTGTTTGANKEVIKPIFIHTTKGDHCIYAPVYSAGRSVKQIQTPYRVIITQVNAIVTMRKNILLSWLKSCLECMNWYFVK